MLSLMSGSERISRLLVVDDDDASRSLLTSVLENWGYWVVEARSGGEALALLQKRDFTAMLTDLQMPVLDGFVLVRQVRAREERTGRPRLPVMAVSAHATLAARRECARLGFDRVLAKPFDWDAVAAAVKELCGSTESETVTVRKVGPEVRMLVPGFLAARRREHLWMESCLAEGDFEQIGRLGHRLKGSGGSFGFPELTSVGARLEAAAKVADADGCGAALDDLARCLSEAGYAA
jgi:CheY-like chemotaxis protein